LSEQVRPLARATPTGLPREAEAALAIGTVDPSTTVTHASAASGTVRLTAVVHRGDVICAAVHHP